MTIAFDIDDTLIIPAVATGLDRDTPNYDIIAIYKWFQAQGHDMILWSGGGIDYAQVWGEKLGLHPFTVYTKEKNKDIDVAFDDCDVDLAKINIKVKRINNNVSRQEWNKKEKNDILKCHICGIKFIPDKESINFNTKKWDGHTYIPNCKCLINGIKIITG